MKSSNGFLKVIGRGAILTLPLLLFMLAISLLSIGVMQTIFAETQFIRLFSDLSKSEYSSELDKDNVIIVSEKIEEHVEKVEIPTIYYSQQFATLNIDGWELRDIPVRLGADEDTLLKSAGMSLTSFFCGEGGRTVISAHVTKHFRELEDTPLGATVAIDTIYGKYTYRVSKKEVFNLGETELITTDAAKNELVLYTCYPRDNGGRRREQLCALICTPVSGREAIFSGAY